MARKAAGKYDGVLHKLQKIASTETPQHQQRVESAKAEIADEIAHAEKPAIAAARIYRMLRQEKDILQAQISEINVRLDACTQLLVDLQEREAEGFGEYGASMSMLRLVTGDTLRIAPEPYTTVEDRDALREYFVSNHMERMLAPAWTTVNALNKDRLLAGDPELPGTKLYIKTGIVFTPMTPDTIDETVTRAARTESDL